MRSCGGNKYCVKAIETGELVFFSLRLMFHPILSSRSVARGAPQGPGPSCLGGFVVDTTSSRPLKIGCRNILVRRLALRRSRRGYSIDIWQFFTTRAMGQGTTPRRPHP